MNNNLSNIAQSFEKFCPEKIHIGLYDWVQISSGEYTYLTGGAIMVHQAQSEEPELDNEEFQTRLIQDCLINLDESLDGTAFNEAVRDYLA